MRNVTRALLFMPFSRIGAAAGTSGRFVLSLSRLGRTLERNFEPVRSAVLSRYFRIMPDPDSN